jgi:hypothetical protein
VRSVNMWRSFTVAQIWFSAILRSGGADAFLLARPFVCRRCLVNGYGARRAGKYDVNLGCPGAMGAVTGDLASLSASVANGRLQTWTLLKQGVGRRVMCMDKHSDVLCESCCNSTTWSVPVSQVWINVVRKHCQTGIVFRELGQSIRSAVL